MCGGGEGLWLVQCSRDVQGFRSCDSRVTGIEPRGRRMVEHQPLHKAKAVTCNAGYTDMRVLVCVLVCVCACVCVRASYNTPQSTLSMHTTHSTPCHHTHCTYVCLPHQHSTIMPSHHKQSSPCMVSQSALHSLAIKLYTSLPFMLTRSRTLSPTSS